MLALMVSLMHMKLLLLSRSAHLSTRGAAIEVAPIRARDLPSACLRQHSSPSCSKFWPPFLDHKLAIHDFRAGGARSCVRRYRARSGRDTSEHRLSTRTASRLRSSTINFWRLAWLLWRGRAHLPVSTLWLRTFPSYTILTCRCPPCGSEPSQAIPYRILQIVWSGLCKLRRGAESAQY